MKKILIILFILSIIFTASCISTERNKSLINYDGNSTKSIYRNNTDSKYLSKNQNFVEYFKANNIDEYKYTLSGDALKVWIKNYNSMTNEQKAKIKNDLGKFYIHVEIIENINDIK